MGEGTGGEDGGGGAIEVGRRGRMGERPVVR